ncbi:TPA: hypothetical protein SL658_000896 [Pseudomonas aeruginosa]|uniref:hypothetical protein n=1 Tax=Pseudomonas aeruginosa TaxID=287 RepID=UPI00188949C2|nr:hypothetical protein [Pseudomonas aeruginosa]MBF1867504.1 hypothetical protein [Pseudomonas aeruginosa]HBP5443763.1 hypothetical protein [Pseudomonas aeruginosa]HCF9849681.1 hypothetical protein [Pseudomonas aeruginosa]HEJ5133693.1 hypothetical protein [Pseudomonas aeruginosa]
MKLLRVFVSAFLFTGILAGCLALLLLVILMVRFPPLLIAVLLACWMLSHLLERFKAAAIVRGKTATSSR